MLVRDEIYILSLINCKPTHGNFRTVQTMHGGASILRPPIQPETCGLKMEDIYINLLYLYNFTWLRP